jgi:hypothetical protein
MLIRTASFALSALLGLTIGPAVLAGPVGHSLLGARVGDVVSVPAFEYEAGKRFATDIAFRRIEVYAPDARIFVDGPDGRYEMPRSQDHYFVSDPEHSGTRAWLAIAPRSGALRGSVFDQDGPVVIEGSLGERGSIEVTASRRGPTDMQQPFECAGAPVVSDQPAHADRIAPDALAPQSSPRTAVIAVDTDSSLLSRKFSNNAAAANTYMADLFAGLNTMYQRDLQLTLQIGTVELRTNPGSDPFAGQSSGLASSTHLSQFSEYWRVNRVGVARTLAMLLSGKATAPGSTDCSSSGIAWLLNTANNWCSATGTVQGGGQTAGHYSVSRVFTCAFIGTNAAFDVGLVGHELAHNLGARHTHCTAANGSNPNTDVAIGTIDQCRSGEPGCFNGATSCPTESILGITGQGTVMSYCGQFQGGAACIANGGQPLNAFHPTHQAFLDGRINANVSSGCITTGSGGGLPCSGNCIFRDSFGN